jgi:NAD(P)-dependent dehydrogenase (short-subunit alcohol dehydrogenase family)
LGEYKNLVALVTGASRGVGAATSSFLAQRGYDIVVNYHSKRSRAEAVAATVRAFGRRALVAQADLTRTADVASMMESIRSGRHLAGQLPGYRLKVSALAFILMFASLPLLQYAILYSDAIGRDKFYKSVGLVCTGPLI